MCEFWTNTVQRTGSRSLALIIILVMGVTVALASHLGWRIEAGVPGIGEEMVSALVFASLAATLAAIVGAVCAGRDAGLARTVLGAVSGALIGVAVTAPWGLVPYFGLRSLVDVLPTVLALVGALLGWIAGGGDLTPFRAILGIFLGATFFALSPLAIGWPPFALVPLVIGMTVAAVAWLIRVLARPDSRRRV